MGNDKSKITVKSLVILDDPDTGKIIRKKNDSDKKQRYIHEKEG